VAAARERLGAAGGEVFAATADLTDPDAYRQWVDDAAAALGGVDCFVQNVSAGGGSEGEKSWQQNFQLDVLASVRAAEFALPHLQQRPGGSLLFIGTTAAVETFVRPQAYNAMKAALITYAKQLGQVVGEQGVRVNVVSPGPIEFTGGSWDTIRQNMRPFYDATVAATPLGRLGSPEEVARAVVFLSSPAASWVTGVNLIVDGGYTKRVQF
jgi:NAD(P)-dependent dehydrogenase (short-subunit alcohol dehydrogenase family)